MSNVAPHELTLTVDGVEHRLSVSPADRLVETLRVQCGNTAPKLNCGTGDCGACTVLRDGLPVKACLEIALDSSDSQIVTLRGLASSEGELHPVQQAFWDAFGFQCGFCLSGMVLVAKNLLDRDPDPSDEDIRAAISGNLCRCTGYEHIVAAVKLAAQRMNAAPRPAAVSAEASAQP